MSSDSMLDSIHGLILDMDGVLWRGNRPIEGAAAFLKNLKDHDMPHLFVTNNATSTPSQIHRRALKLGIELSPQRILTSSQAAMTEVQRRFPHGARLFVIGESGLKDVLETADFKLLESADSADAVIVGLDRNVTWAAMSEAVYAIASGAVFIGTNGDVSFPTERGFAPGNGAILAALERSTGVQPIVVGKPEPHLFLEAAEMLQLEPARILVIGDRLETDIAGGENAGMRTALILTGASRKEQLDQSPVEPDYVFDNLSELSVLLWSDRR